MILKIVSCAFLVLFNQLVFSVNGEQIFTQVFLNNGFGQSVSVSGPGSNLIQTQAIREEFPKILKEYQIFSILDAPCGDFFWMRHIDLSNYAYLGIDIVKQLITDNLRNYSAYRRTFAHMDIATAQLPKVDLILSRDLLVHLPYTEIVKVLKNFKRSGSKYLLTTTFIGTSRINIDLSQNFGWRILNLQKEPFHFPQPIYILDEKCTEHNGAFSDKCLALWELDQIKI